MNRDAKTSGGIKYFASDPNAILKWMLNRSTQAKNTEALYDLANIKSSELVYKSLRPSNIMKSENFVEKITKVMTMEYLNPFNVKLDPENLYNLSSGVPVEASLTEEILSVKQLREEENRKWGFQDKRPLFAIKIDSTPPPPPPSTIVSTIISITEPSLISQSIEPLIQLAPT